MASAGRSDSGKLLFEVCGGGWLQLSENPFKYLAKRLTSKLNTRVRFPSPAPTFQRSGGDGCHFQKTGRLPKAFAIWRRLAYAKQHEERSQASSSSPVGTLPGGGLCPRLF